MFEFLLWYFEVESQLGFKPDGKASLRLWRLNYSAWEAVREIRASSDDDVDYELESSHWVDWDVEPPSQPAS